MQSMPLNDFESAGRAVLAFLHARLGMGLWMITRVEGEDWIVLQAEDHHYGVSAGKVLRWEDSFCAAMVRGEGPRVARDADAVPAYAAAPIRRDLSIRAYVGVPLQHADGRLFGTLCAIDPQPGSPLLEEQQALVELLAKLLGTILHADLAAVEQARQLEHLALEAQTDALTALPNRRAWDACLLREEERCRRYGTPAALIAIDLNDLKRTNDTEGHAAGDALIVRAAEALRSVVREPDLVARLGGDEYGVVAVNCNADGAQSLQHRIRAAFAAHGVKASLGSALRHPAGGLAAAWEQADLRMYEEKKIR